MSEQMELSKIGELIRTQDNRLTDQPMLLVQREHKEYGYSKDHADDYDWLNVDEEGQKADESQTELLDDLSDKCHSTGGWEKCFYKTHWAFVTACFTENGCLEYISINGHNIRGKIRIYADGTFRNNEWQAVRSFLINNP